MTKCLAQKAGVSIGLCACQKAGQTGPNAAIGCKSGKWESSGSTQVKTTASKRVMKKGLKMISSRGIGTLCACLGLLLTVSGCGIKSSIDNVIDEVEKAR